MPQASDGVPMRPEQDGQAPDGTYRYEGGPMAPVPIPKDEDTSNRVPRISSPAAERVMSLRQAAPLANKGKWVYPAYGEEPRRTGR